MQTLLSPNDIFNLEKDALEKLKTFQTTYADYVRCGPDTDTAARALYEVSGNKCSSSPKTYADVDADYTKALSALTLLENAIYQYASNNSAGTSSSPVVSRSSEHNVFDASYNEIMNNYGYIKNLRQDLDAKLSDLYEIGDTKSNFYQRKLMSNSYTKILLTILATSLTVVVFISMSRKS